MRELATEVLVPSAVVGELDSGLRLGLDLPLVQDLEWVSEVAASRKSEIRRTDLGPGEIEVLAVALERPGVVAVLDDAWLDGRPPSSGSELRAPLGFF